MPFQQRRIAADMGSERWYLLDDGRREASLQAAHHLQRNQSGTVCLSWTDAEYLNSARIDKSYSDGVSSSQVDQTPSPRLCTIIESPSKASQTALEAAGKVFKWGRAQKALTPISTDA